MMKHNKVACAQDSLRMDVQSDNSSIEDPVTANYSSPSEYVHSEIPSSALSRVKSANAFQEIDLSSMAHESKANGPASRSKVTGKLKSTEPIRYRMKRMSAKVEDASFHQNKVEVEDSLVGTPSKNKMRSLSDFYSNANTFPVASKKNLRNNFKSANNYIVPDEEHSVSTECNGFPHQLRLDSSATRECLSMASSSKLKEQQISTRDATMETFLSPEEEITKAAFQGDDATKETFNLPPNIEKPPHLTSQSLATYVKIQREGLKRGNCILCTATIATFVITIVLTIGILIMPTNLNQKPDPVLLYLMKINSSLRAANASYKVPSSLQGLQNVPSQILPNKTSL